MAKVAKYLVAERKRQEHVETYKKSLDRYVAQQKVKKASNADLINMIFSQQLTSVENFLKSDNPEFWQELMTRVKSIRREHQLKTLQQILLHVAEVSDTFFIEIDNLRTLFTIAQLEPDFIRPIEKWIPKSRNRFKQLHELLRHLFAKFEVPDFLDKGFVKGELESIQLFINIGAGKSFKDFEFTPKIPLNKKTYHHLFTTPEHYTFFEAFRRAQILSNNGTERLAHYILGTFLHNFQDTVAKSETPNKEDFWLTVMNFFIAQPMFDYNQIGPICDYIKEKKYTYNVVNGRTVPPEQPNFLIKGRTLAALLRQTEEWHTHLSRVGVAKNVNVKSWKGIDLENYHVLLTNQQTYEIVQYTTSAELVQEGSEMRHCVSSYARSCAEGRVSIWSLRQIVKKGLDIKKCLTIELDSSRRIVQIRGKNNRKPEAFESSIISLWAVKENLTVSKFV